ncbi:hypothetical protein B0A52_09240 [Exophiala mesophila]|uniref:Uncharacterized protein n=1 Tax=Exophiala mesophila TaxID=212818 RepID=A0A438MTJ6_EXOME|nr:hypothetical protein B0A52_09240 [Exophiala mesophila]
MSQLELLSHFYSVTWPSLGGILLSEKATVELLFKYAVSAPYLMHEVLAISALHLAVLRPEHVTYFRDYSVGLQTRAITLFNGAKTVVNQSTCVPMFLFSTFLGIQVLCDTLNYYQEELNAFLDQFVTYLHLHRGVRAVINQSWDALRNTELKPIIESTPPRSVEDSGRVECDDLKDLIDKSDLSESSVAVYHDTIKDLRWVFRIVGRPGAQFDNPQLVFAWPTVISAEYVSLLQQRRPEALVILAYFAALLHRHRQFWCFNDGGTFLVRSISDYLGPYWNTALAWPLDVINGTTRE